MDGKIIGVIDVQVERTHQFFPQDGEIMSIMAGHLSVLRDNIRLVRSRQQIAEIVKTISHQFLSENELKPTLDMIAHAANEQLKADPVILYERNPYTGEIMTPVYAGRLYEPDLFNVSVPDPDSLVRRLLSDTSESEYFQSSVSDAHDPPFDQEGDFEEMGIVPFVEREKIKSRAIICLETESDRVGIMFLNFRSWRDFDQSDRESYFTFAHLAALAIQKAQSHQEEIQFERENLARQLHDQLIANAYAITRIVHRVRRDLSAADAHYSILTTAQEAAEDLMRDVRYLNETLKDRTLGDFAAEIEKLIQRAQNAYRVNFDLNWSGQSRLVPSAVSAQLKLILNEAIVNAIKHGNAADIRLDLKVSSSQVFMKVEDFGSGFDPSRVRPGGLANMKERARRLKGDCTYDSQVGKGTRIEVKIPLNSAT